MPRTEFQPGPAEDHYHNTLGPSEQATSSGVTIEGVTTFAASTIVAPGATESAPGVATIPVTPTIQTGDTAPLPLFVGNVDPTLDPDTADLVVPGARWIDTTFGPPYVDREFEEGGGPS